MGQKFINDRKEKPVALIVEDNTSLRHYIQHLFEEQYSTLEAENGKTGYEIARRRLPDLIVSDLMMPTMDGIEFCRLVKADKATCCIPFLLLTARASGENKLAGLESGADDYILKPFDNHELMVRAANLVASRQKFKETARQQLDKVRLDAFINAQEQERSKIASELHDSIGQMLALVKINLARIDASLQASPAVVMEGMGGFNDQEESLSFTTHNGEFMEIFNETLQLLDETCMELRRISHNMMSPELEHINLEEALKNLLWKSLKNQQVVYEINCYKIPEKIDRLIKINLYRIVQEAMANIIRHAKASKITVQLMGGAEDMNLLIEDNGQGFNLETNRDGIGLKNIRSRVELMKGSLDIDSVHGRGTIININVPWES
jgi:signal transduction histidine kinase